MHVADTARSVRLDLRERALFGGAELLSSAELVAVLLGTGSEGEPATRLAAALLDSTGSLEALARLGPNALSSFRGVGPAKAARLAAAFELGRRALQKQLSVRKTSIGRFEAVVEWAQPLVVLEHEEVWLLSLDGRNGLKSARRVAQGGLHGCALTPRDVLGPALRDAASAILLVHNHPSGDPEPSREDVSMTHAVAAACEIVGVPLLDHVVVARSGARSVAQSEFFGL
jgi:DNA repair protein RadC